MLADPLGESSCSRLTMLLFDLSPNSSQSFADMVRTNQNMPPKKVAKGSNINEGGSNPPKREREELQPRDIGKSKKHIAKKGVTIETQVEWSKPEDDQRLIHRQNRLRDRPQPTPTRVSSAAAPPKSDTVPAQEPPVTPALPIVPPPRLLNRLKCDGLRTIIEEKLLSMEGMESKHPDVLETL
uniref:Integrase core domain containing protein n=1 Tax=Solanum tuberosum TaxID=4113 RepID=M1DT99_SOLTU